jgi:hypothetical protein
MIAAKILFRKIPTKNMLTAQPVSAVRKVFLSPYLLSILAHKNPKNIPVKGVTPIKVLAATELE